MIGLLLHLVRLCPFLFGGHRQLALENLALRQQLAVYKRTATRPKLRNGDRLFWAWLSRVWTSWRTALVIVTPDTVLHWQRRRFRDYWTTLSGRPTVGRPPVHAEIKALVAQMAAANPLWGAPRIHGELLKLGIAVSERTVSRLMPKRSGPPSVPDQPRPGPRLDRFLRRSHRSPPRALRPRGARPPSAANSPLQRDRTPHGRMVGAANRGRLAGRRDTRLSPPRSGLGLRRFISATSEKPADL